MHTKYLNKKLTSDLWFKKKNGIGVLPVAHRIGSILGALGCRFSPRLQLRPRLQYGWDLLPDPGTPCANTMK